MNKALVIADEVQETARRLRSKPDRFEWRWLIMICMLLGISGGIRYWRDWQFDTLSKESEALPFALGEIPNALGDWHAVEGSERYPRARDCPDRWCS